MRGKKNQTTGSTAVLPGTRVDRLRVTAQAQAMAEAASRWTDLAEYADAWGARRFAWLANRAAAVAQSVLEQARRATLDEATIEVVRTFVATAQEEANQAALFAQQAPRVPLQPCVVDCLREAQRSALFAWLFYSDNGQLEARVEIANLRAAYEVTRRQYQLAAWLYARVAKIRALQAMQVEVVEAISA